jgi:DNA-binding transcriptional MerR regulator
VFKIAFSINEVSRLTGVPAHTIRFWEKDFNQYVRPAKTPGGQRRYCAGDIEMIKRIRQLRYQDKYTISGTLEELQREDKRGFAGVSYSGAIDDVREVFRVKETINNR